MYMESGNISDEEDASLLAAGSTPALLKEQKYSYKYIHMTIYIYITIIIVDIIDNIKLAQNSNSQKNLV